MTTLKLEILKSEALAEELKDEERVLSTEQQGAESSDTRFFRAPEKVWMKAFPGNYAKEGDVDRVLEELAQPKRRRQRPERGSQSVHLRE